MVKKAKEGTQAPKGWTPFDASAHKESPERATRLSNAAHKAWATRRAQGWKPKGLAPLSPGDTCPRCGCVVTSPNYDPPVADYGTAKRESTRKPKRVAEREAQEAQEAEAHKRHLAAVKANETRKRRAEEAQRESERASKKVNAVGKPYGRNFDPKYKVKHKVESIRRLAKPQKGIPFVVEEPLSGKKIKKVRVAA